jgi:hypothetical protein
VSLWMEGARAHRDGHVYFVDVGRTHSHSLDDLIRRGGGGVLLSDGDKMPSYYCYGSHQNN